jgi:FeS assembly SUF system regulator
MLRISRLTDYAVVLASRLAICETAEAVSDLARVTEIPAPTVSKVLKLLAKGGVVTSTRGANGGYTLSRPAHAITVADIVTSIEGPIAVTECVDDNTCEHEGHCGVRGNWQRINDAVLTAISGITLADMARTELTLVPLARSRAEALALREKRGVALP